MNKLIGVDHIKSLCDESYKIIHSDQATITLYKLNSHSSSIIKQACELDVEIVVKKVFKNITYQGSNLWYQQEKRACSKTFSKIISN